MKTKILIRLIIFVFIILFSCKNKDVEEAIIGESKAQVRLLIYENVYEFKLEQNRVDNNAIITTTSEGEKYTSLMAIDANTFDNDVDQQLRIIIGYLGGSSGDYTFLTDPDDPNTPQASITINLPGDHLNSMSDFISWENGIITVTEVGEVGGYIEGAIDGKFKDTQLGNGFPIQDMPETMIHGEFKIYRAQ
jgi:hypothetical protein